MKKGDLIIAAAVLCAAALCFGLLRLTHRSAGTTVTVKQDNATVFTGDLADDHTVTLDTNTITIENGSVRMEKSDCKNQICVHHAAITKAGESIICLPNKVIVTIS